MGRQRSWQSRSYSQCTMSPIPRRPLWCLRKNNYYQYPSVPSPGVHPTLWMLCLSGHPAPQSCPSVFLHNSDSHLQSMSNRYPDFVKVENTVRHSATGCTNDFGAKALLKCLRFDLPDVFSGGDVMRDNGGHVHAVHNGTNSGGAGCYVLRARTGHMHRTGHCHMIEADRKNREW